ncbi:DUF2806 domain-containing protein [Citrobacter farmeri]|uniref:DUF2806 domain-containing protein n=1 Tax=Citrobacter farmeri TaxID=67824 RepID=UPI000F681681|nr:DUF2806 domain-containing protein [Citrobacter farmeri]RSB14968.1 DUF2806 domain-containing protein [Citrobacter farmeri]
MVDGPYEKLFIKLWDTLIDKGVCGVLRPWQIKREGLALASVARFKILSLAQAEQDAKKIRDGLLVARIEKDGVMLRGNPDLDSPLIDLPSMYSAIEDDLVADALYKEINFANCILKTEELLKEQPGDAPEKQIDKDWIHRWRDNVYQVSSDEMQLLWAKILAGELKSPGKFSLRTMEFLKNLTVDEAKDIEEITPFIFQQGFIFRGYLYNEDGLKRRIHNWLSYDLLLRMEELGVVQGVSDDRNEVSLQNNTDSGLLCICNNKALRVVGNSEGKYTFPHIQVTKLGVQLAEIANCQANEEYVIEFGQTFKRSDATVYLGDWYKKEVGFIQFHNSKQI